MQTAIITGDLISSTRYKPEYREEAITTLKSTLESVQEANGEKWLHYEMYRGDSVQVEVLKVEKALLVALLIRASLKTLLNSSGSKQKVKKNVPTFSRPYADIRLSIGIGDAGLRLPSIVESDGEAFRLSGRTLDTMKKKGQNIIITTNNKDLNEEFEVECKFLDLVIDRWSTFSAEVVLLSLKGLKDIEIAEKIEVSPTAIHLRKKAAGWDAIDLMLQRFESKIMKTIY